MEEKDKLTINSNEFFFSTVDGDGTDLKITLKEEADKICYGVPSRNYPVYLKNANQQLCLLGDRGETKLKKLYINYQNRNFDFDELKKIIPEVTSMLKRASWEYGTFDFSEAGSVAYKAWSWEQHGRWHKHGFWTTDGTEGWRYGADIILPFKNTKYNIAGTTNGNIKSIRLVTGDNDVSLGDINGKSNFSFDFSCGNYTSVRVYADTAESSSGHGSTIEKHGTLFLTAKIKWS